LNLVWSAMQITRLAFSTSTVFDNAVYTFNGGEYVNSFSLEN